MVLEQILRFLFGSPSKPSRIKLEVKEGRTVIYNGIKGIVLYTDSHDNRVLMAIDNLNDLEDCPGAVIPDPILEETSPYLRRLLFKHADYYNRYINAMWVPIEEVEVISISEEERWF